MNGWTRSLPQSVKRENELETVFGFWLRQPFNPYWRNRLYALLFPDTP